MEVREIETMTIVLQPFISVGLSLVCTSTSRGSYTFSPGATVSLGNSRFRRPNTSVTTVVTVTVSGQVPRRTLSQGFTGYFRPYVSSSASVYTKVSIPCLRATLTYFYFFYLSSKVITMTHEPSYFRISYSPKNK